MPTQEQTRSSLRSDTAFDDWFKRRPESRQDNRGTRHARISFLWWDGERSYMHIVDDEEIEEAGKLKRKRYVCRLREGPSKERLQIADPIEFEVVDQAKGLVKIFNLPADLAR